MSQRTLWGGMSIFPVATAKEGSLLLVTQDVTTAWIKYFRQGKSKEAAAVLDEAIKQNKVVLLENVEVL